MTTKETDEQVIDRLIKENTLQRERIRKNEALVHSKIPETIGMTFDGVVTELIYRVSGYKKIISNLEDQLRELKKIAQNCDNDQMVDKIEATLREHQKSLTALSKKQ